MLGGAGGLLRDLGGDAGSLAGATKPCPAAKVVTANLSDATITVSGGVAKATIGYGATPLSQLANAVAAQARAMGANTVVIDTGTVADPGLAGSLAARAASGEGFLGGTVQSTGTSLAPRFTITIPLPK
jgi:hypothetical protein